VASAPRLPRLRLSARSAVIAVALLGAALVAMRLVAASGRVLGWIVAAMLLAALLNPAVAVLDRRLHRGAALFLVVLATLAVAGTIVWAVVDDIVNEVDELQTAVPRAARDLERSERFGKTARDVDLADKAQEFVDQLPERLRGGNVQDALRSAATRGVAFLATTVLTIFFLIHGPRLLTSATAQLPDERQEQVRRLGAAAYRRAWRYMAGSLGMALAAGVLTYVVAQALSLPGPAPLALWVALFDLVPLVGLVVGGLPVVLLALADSPDKAVVVAVVLVGWQLFEAMVLQRRLEARSLHVGPFVTVALAMIGLELYGIGGALAAVALAVVAAALADELLPTDPTPDGGESVIDTVPAE
jgi:predicted PurR-regulated permease PerM